MLDIKRIDIAEFRKLGFLHEVNRLLLHPLGLALEVNTIAEPVRKITLTEREAQALERALSDGGLPPTSKLEVALLDALCRGVRIEGGEELGGVWDCREDPEGVAYGPDLLDAPKAQRVAAEMLARRVARKKKLGFVIQPVEGDKPTLTTTYVDPAERTGRGRKSTEFFTGIGEVQFEEDDR